MSDPVASDPTKSLKGRRAARRDRFRSEVLERHGLTQRHGMLDPVDAPRRAAASYEYAWWQAGGRKLATDLVLLAAALVALAGSLTAWHSLRVGWFDLVVGVFAVAAAVSTTRTVRTTVRSARADGFGLDVRMLSGAQRQVAWIDVMGAHLHAPASGSGQVWLKLSIRGGPPMILISQGSRGVGETARFAIHQLLQRQIPVQVAVAVEPIIRS
jgi:hypothetical protein